MESVFNWCHHCQHPVYAPEGAICPTCNHRTKYLTTDARPVFARERRILQYFGHGPLTNEAVWRSGKSRFYYINGESASLPSSAELKDQLPAIARYIRDSYHYDSLDEQLIQDYRRQLKVNINHLRAIEDEAFQFVNHAVKRFPRRLLMVSFSGGKDSTAVSSVVRRALSRSDILHIFGDTTLEDEHTYEYVERFQEENPLIPFFNARAEHDFHELVDQMGPPSRVMRWCCTIFKAGPINNLLQTLGDQKVLTFYGIRHNESVRRSKYHRMSWNDPDRLGTVVSVDQDAELNAVTVGAKIGQQATASPIIDWTEFDVWLYILLNELDFNKSYRLGYSRVGCWLCPLNSEWSEMLASIFFPEDAARWRAQLIDFATRIGKPDPEEYIDDRGWVKRFGGAGHPNQFHMLEVKPCGDMANTRQVEVNRPVNVELEEFLKPLGKIIRDRCRPALGEIYLEGRPNQDWDALIVQAPENSTTIRFTVINPKKPIEQLSHYFKHQASKFQTCIQCTACSAACPHGAITIKPDQRIYEIDQDVCTGCMECVTHFGSTGCLVAKSLSVFGSAKEQNSASIALPMLG
ncbi:MAG: phosphoadenosine phosphosulfate reductase family protein [Anaerolineales bacterium]|nr:phosphoadenosine phosphosulfate reductase family protein [Anaerolineales bacterium]